MGVEAREAGAPPEADDVSLLQQTGAAAPAQAATDVVFTTPDIGEGTRVDAVVSTGYVSVQLGVPQLIVLKASVMAAEADSLPPHELSAMLPLVTNAVISATSRDASEAAQDIARSYFRWDVGGALVVLACLGVTVGSLFLRNTIATAVMASIAGTATLLATVIVFRRVYQIQSRWLHHVASTLHADVHHGATALALLGSHHVIAAVAWTPNGCCELPVEYGVHRGPDVLLVRLQPHQIVPVAVIAQGDEAGPTIAATGPTANLPVIAASEQPHL